MSQVERMLAYAKGYADKVVRRNKGRVVAIYLSGTLSAELQGESQGLQVKHKSQVKHYSSRVVSERVRSAGD